MGCALLSQRHKLFDRCLVSAIELKNLDPNAQLSMKDEKFYILRRDDCVDAYIEALRKLELYDDFEMVCGDVYYQIFSERAEKNRLSF